MSEPNSLDEKSASAELSLFPDIPLPQSSGSALPSAASDTVQRKRCRRSPRRKSKEVFVQMPYQAEFAQRLLAFFDVPPFRVTEVQKKDGSIALLETASELPTFAAFARSLGTTQAQLMRWEEEHADFAEAAKKARDLQGDILIQNSLRGNYSSSFAVFTAKNILGWTDGREERVAAVQPLIVRWEK